MIVVLAPKLEEVYLALLEVYIQLTVFGCDVSTATNHTHTPYPILHATPTPQIPYYMPHPHPISHITCHTHTPYPILHATPTPHTPYYMPHPHPISHTTCHTHTPYPILHATPTPHIPYYMPHPHPISHTTCHTHTPYPILHATPTPHIPYYMPHPHPISHTTCHTHTPYPILHATPTPISHTTCHTHIPYPILHATPTPHIPFCMPHPHPISRDRHIMLFLEPMLYSSLSFVPIMFMPQYLLFLHYAHVFRNLHLLWVYDTSFHCIFVVLSYFYRKSINSSINDQMSRISTCVPVMVILTTSSPIMLA